MSADRKSSTDSFLLHGEDPSNCLLSMTSWFQIIVISYSNELGQILCEPEASLFQPSEFLPSGCEGRNEYKIFFLKTQERAVPSRSLHAVFSYGPFCSPGAFRRVVPILGVTLSPGSPYQSHGREESQKHDLTEDKGNKMIVVQVLFQL